jgi:hypothetical protein
VAKAETSSVVGFNVAGRLRLLVLRSSDHDGAVHRSKYASRVLEEDPTRREQRHASRRADEEPGRADPVLAGQGAHGRGETKTVLDLRARSRKEAAMAIEILSLSQIELMRRAGRIAAETLTFVGAPL